MNRRLYIKKVKRKGRGVFCTDLILKDEVFEVCPLITLPAEDYDAIMSTHLINYLFQFDPENKIAALALGFGSLYNHAIHSNAAYSLDTESKLMSYYALEDILPGAEICINYGGEYGKEFKEWFETRSIRFISEAPTPVRITSQSHRNRRFG